MIPVIAHLTALCLPYSSLTVDPTDAGIYLTKLVHGVTKAHVSLKKIP
jgi:hypothetical protein